MVVDGREYIGKVGETVKAAKYSKNVLFYEENENKRHYPSY